MMPPVECMPWCEAGDGHPGQITVVDQSCFSPGRYLYLPLNRRVRCGDLDIDAEIGVAAKREIGLLPCVHVHLLLADPDLDVGIKFTPAEARWLAEQLLKVAELVDYGSEGNQTAPVCV